MNDQIRIDFVGETQITQIIIVMKGETLLAVIRFALLLILIILIALLAIFGPSNTSESKNVIASRLLLNENFEISSVKYPVTVITKVVTTTSEVTTLYLDPSKFIQCSLIPKVHFF